MARWSPDWAVLLGPLRQAGPGRYAVALNLGVPLEDLDSELGVFIWSVQHWPHVSIYALNRQRIGAGFRLFSMPKHAYVRRFGYSCANGTLRLQGYPRARLVLERDDEAELVNGLAP